jgi:lipid II:glycine glycyltransferase (peptidoglycan interpeptide bridge formation enzyme)
MYQGIIFDESARSMPLHRRAKWILDVTEFLLTEMEQRYDLISFCLHHAVEDLRSFQWFHYHEPERGQFKIELRYTGLLDLGSARDFDGYLSSIRTVRRQDYRRAESGGLAIEESEDIDTLSRLHRLTFERQGIDRGQEEERLLLAISKAALSKGFGQLLLCRNREGVATSATLFLFDRHCGYYLFAANDPGYRKTGSGTYLILENIRRCQEKGLARVDFVGINSPERGDFKTSFNAKAVPYFVVAWERKEAASSR